MGNREKKGKQNSKAEEKDLRECDEWKNEDLFFRCCAMLEKKGKRAKHKFRFLRIIKERNKQQIIKATTR